MFKAILYLVTVSLLLSCSKNEGEGQPGRPETAFSDPDAYIKRANAPTEESLTGEGDTSIPKTGRWPGFRGDGQKNASETALDLQSLPSDFKPIWKRTITGGYSSFAIQEGRLFTMTKREKAEVVEALDIQTGRKLWEYVYAVDYEKLFPPSSGVFTRAPSGPRSTPALVGNFVYTIGTTGVLNCLEATSGKKVWSQELARFLNSNIPLFGYAGSPFVFQNKVFVQTGSENGKALAAFDAQTGNLLWARHDDPYSYSTAQTIEIDGETQILFFTGSGLVAVSPETGDERWRFGWTTQENQNTATPLVIDGDVLISSGYGSGAALIKMGPQPELLWKTKGISSHFHAAVVHDKHVYGFSDQRLRCIDLTNGKIKWDRPGLGRGSVLLAGDSLIVLSGDGEVILAPASPQHFQPKAAFAALEGISWTSPAFVDGILYLRNEWDISAVDLRPKLR